MSRPGWWYRATNEERLAQIDGGIELGMTASQVALNCGCLYEQNYTNGSTLGSGSLVNHFALNHGRSFPASNKKTSRNGTVMYRGRLMSRKQAIIEAEKDAYFTGQTVDFWGAA